MTSLETVSSKPSQTIRNIILFAVLLLSLAGFLDATYLTIQHFSGQPLACVIGYGCSIVAASRYSTVMNIPVALLGAVYYVIVGFAVLAYFDTKNNRFLRWMAALTYFGLAASLWFLYLQIFVIKALCVYCLFSAATSITLFVLGRIVLKKINHSAVAPETVEKNLKT